MDQSDGGSDDSEYQERLAKMKQFYQKGPESGNKGSLALFEKVSQKNSVI